jgi:small subunit ribosomal protein S6
MFLLNPNAYAKNPNGAQSMVEDLIANAGGKVLASRLWNEQKLAFPVDGHRKGVYWLTYFSLDSVQIPKFNRACQLQDMVLRHLAIKIDPRIADTLSAVAKGEKVLSSDVDVDTSDEEESSEDES